MDNKKTITIIILGLVAMAGILLFLFLPSKSHLANIDFYVYDTNDNFHYEVNERLELLVNDTAAIKGKRLIWEMGNGDTLMRNTDVSYTYRKAGKYLITLKIDGKHSVNKYIKVISGLEHEAIDSIRIMYHQVRKVDLVQMLLPVQHGIIQILLGFWN